MITFNSYLKIKLLQGEHALPTMPLELALKIEQMVPTATYMLSGLFFFSEEEAAKEVFHTLQEPLSMDWLANSSYDGFTVVYGTFDKEDRWIERNRKTIYPLISKE